MKPLSYLPLAAIAWIGLLLVSCSTSSVTAPAVSVKSLPIVHQASPHHYVRTIQSGSDTFSIQTGSRRFRKTGSPEIHLVGAMHAGHVSYYHQLQQILASADLVLFESVSDERVNADKNQPSSKVDRSGYARLASALGYVSQNQAIDTTRSNFRHCDLTIQQIEHMLQEEASGNGAQADAAQKALRQLNKIKKVLMGRAWLTNGAIHLIASSHALRERMRLALVASGATGGENSGLEARLHTMILEDRNAHVIKELRNIIRKESHQHIAIFYGAGHLPDLEKRLLAMGYQPADSLRWHTAMTSHPYSSGITAKEVSEALQHSRSKTDP